MNKASAVPKSPLIIQHGNWLC